jgi:hypothetical protein
MLPPKFEFDARYFDTLRAAIRLLSDEGDISQADQVRAINERAIASTKAGDGGKPPKFSEETYSNFKNGSKTRDWRIMVPMWDWFHTVHHSYLEAAWDAQGGRARASVNGLSLAVHDFLNQGANFDVESAARLAGAWVSFRPYFLDPTQVMISVITFGVEGDDARFTVTSTINRGKETITGSVIPYERSLLLVAKISGSNAPFVVVLTNLITDATGGEKQKKRYCEAEGVCLAGASGKLPSAYPIALHRPHGPVEPACLQMSEFQDAYPESQYPGVSKVLARGFTEWR